MQYQYGTHTCITNVSSRGIRRATARGEPVAHVPCLHTRSHNAGLRARSGDAGSTGARPPPMTWTPPRSVELGMTRRLQWRLTFVGHGGNDARSRLAHRRGQRRQRQDSAAAVASRRRAHMQPPPPSPPWCNGPGDCDCGRTMVRGRCHGRNDVHGLPRRRGRWHRWLGARILSRTGHK